MLAIRPRLVAAVVAVLTVPLAVFPSGPASAVPSPDVVISEVYGGGGNSGATLTNDFIELHNTSASPVSVAGWSVQYASAAGMSWQVTPLSGSIAPGGHYLVQEAPGAGGTTPLPLPDTTGTIPMSATSGKVALVTTTAPLACGTGCVPADSIRDFVGYGPSASSFETAPTGALSNTTAASRDGSGTDTDSNAADFTVGAPNPQNSAFVPPPPPPTGCDAPASDQIAAVQGPGNATPLAGQFVRVEGIVTGDFQGPDQLDGFFVQDDTPDSDPSTSEGLFVFSTLAVEPGDRVLVNGRAVEFNGLTALSPVTAVDVCTTGTIAAAPYELPRPEGVTFEPVEGMLLTFPETLTATEHFQLGRFGEIAVSSDGRLFQPTERVAPGAPAQALLAENARRRLLLDDGSNQQNPPIVPYLVPPTLRIGDTTTGLTGVLSFGFGQYRLEPTAAITFAPTNPRPPAREDVGGDVQVASFNTLNYFTTLTGTNPNARGANNPNEFARQQAKAVAAIRGLDADVLGLMEVENNGPGAIRSLVDALNAATAPGTYAFVTEPSINPANEFGGTFGTDAIKVAFIYKPAIVTPVGPAQTSTDAIFDRPPLIQTFQPVLGGEAFTVAVNHFKSKNCGVSSPADADQGDGQGCFNARRVAQATALAGVLDTLDTTNTLIIGDLNSYSEEDPIHVLEGAGYAGVSEPFIDALDRYSFVFDGFSGELDHALAAPDLFDNVTDATIWHINADEPLILDYNTEFNPPDLYEPDAYRSSDHDPLVLGLRLATPPAAPSASALAGWGAATVSWTAPASGGSEITSYTVRAMVGANVVGSATLAPDVTSHTFGPLKNGVAHRFEVTAENAMGSSPAGTATATPFVPRRYIRIDAGVACPSFTASNLNAFPVSASWLTSRGESGYDVVAANSTITLRARAPRSTLLLLFAGQFQLQDIGLSVC